MRDKWWCHVGDGVVSWWRWERMDAPPPAPAVPCVKPTARRGVWPGTYAEYLATPEFRKIADEARKAWGAQCLISADHPGPVEMHHRSYADVPFREDWHTLIPLCEECHARYHGRLPTPQRGLFDDVELTRAA